MAAPARHIHDHDENQLSEQAARLKLREEQLEFHNQCLKEFASILAHDLKAPLRQTTMFLGMLESDIKSTTSISDASKNAIDGMNIVLDRMRRIIENQYELVKIGALDLNPRPTPIRTVVDDAIALSKDHLSARDARIDIAEIPTLSVDPDLIARVFQTLLINACNHSGAKRPTINISCERDDIRQCMNIHVDDNGPGVPAGCEESIFEPSGHHRSRTEIEDTDVGLALCRRIMSLHRGSIYVDPDFKIGARLVLSFPI